MKHTIGALFAVLAIAVPAAYATDELKAKAGDPAAHALGAMSEGEVRRWTKRRAGHLEARRDQEP